MKHFGISSLLAGTLLLILLDAAPIPSSSSCKDKRARKAYENYQQTRNNLIQTGLIPKQLSLPQPTAGKAIDYGATWAELSGEITLVDPKLRNYISEFGIAYKVNDNDPDIKLIDVPAKELKEDNTFTVEISGLRPDIPYIYHAYIVGSQEVFQGLKLYSKGRVFTTKMKD